MNQPIPYGAPADFVPASLAGGTAELGDIFGAAADQMRLVDSSNAAYSALQQAYDDRTRAVKLATGVDLGNPFAMPPGAGGARGGTELIVPQQRARYADKLAELAKQFPQFSDSIKADVPVQQDAEALAKGADDKLGELLASNPSWPAWVASFGGGAAASFLDPIVVGSLFLGGGAGAARSTFGRILETAAREALVNAGTTAAQQPFVQAWRKEAGLPNGWDQASQNVLMAAALGGMFGSGAGAVHAGAHAIAETLGKARAALPADARGAIDAVTLDQATAAHAPEGVTPERFDANVGAADKATQAVDVRAETPDPVNPPNIESEVAQITDSLAPHPDSVSGPPLESQAGSPDRLATLLAKTGEGSQRVPTPILDHIRALGGVDPKSEAAAELRAAGVTSPSIYKKGGLKAFDNLPHSELPEAERFSIADDGNGYADPNALVAKAGEEAQGNAGGVASVDAERAALEARGVDFSAPADQVRAKLGELAEIDRRYRAADAVDGLSTDELASVPEGVSRREHTAQLVRRALELQPGLPAERIRAAVNLSLFENTPIDQAVSDAMSDAAGVPRESAVTAALPIERPEGSVNLSELPSAPPALEDEITGAAELPKLDLEAERAAFEAMGFGGDVKLPIGDELVSLNELEARLEASRREVRVVEACAA